MAVLNNLVKSAYIYISAGNLVSQLSTSQKVNLHALPRYGKK